MTGFNPAVSCIGYGTATAGGNSTITDNAQNWVTNSLANHIIIILSGTGASQMAIIASNTGTAITINGTWQTNPDTTSVYAIFGAQHFNDVSTLEGISANNLLAVGVLLQGSLQRLAAASSLGDATNGTKILVISADLFNGATYDRQRDANTTQGTAGTGLPGASPQLWASNSTYTRQISSGWSDGQAGNQFAGVGVWMLNGSNFDRIYSQQKSRTVSAANTQVQTVVQMFNLKQFAIIVTGSAAFASQNLTVEVSTDNVNWVTIDTLNIGTGTSFAKQYDETHLGTTLAVNPSVFTYMRITTPAIGGGNTTTTYLAAKQ